jgi:hypothetical protein
LAIDADATIFGYADEQPVRWAPIRATAVPLPSALYSGAVGLLVAFALARRATANTARA